MLWPTEPRTTVCGVEQVLQLQYRVRWLSDDVSVRNDAAPVTVQLAGFSCSLSGETLIAEPSSDYSSVDAARAALEPALHAWEASSELDQGLRFTFKYTGSAVHDLASSQQRAVAIDDVPDSRQNVIERPARRKHIVSISPAADGSRMP